MIRWRCGFVCLQFFCCLIGGSTVIGCGSQLRSNATLTSTPATPTPAPANQPIDVSGNWQIQAILQPVQPVTVQFPRLDIGAALSYSSGQISGTMRIQHGQCGGQKYGPYLGSEAILVAGAVDSTGNFTVNAASASGTTFNASGQVSADGGTISIGSFSAYESACKKSSSGTLTGSRLAALAGNWGGTVAFESTLNPTVTTSINIVEQLAQSPTADGQGFFPVSGTVTMAKPLNPLCLSGSTFTVTGSLNGEEGFITLTDVNNHQLTLGIDGFSSGYMYADAILNPTTTGCGLNMHGEGSLTKQ